MRIKVKGQMGTQGAGASIGPGNSPGSALMPTAEPCCSLITDGCSHINYF